MPARGARTARLVIYLHRSRHKTAPTAQAARRQHFLLRRKACRGRDPSASLHATSAAPLAFGQSHGSKHRDRLAYSINETKALSLGRTSIYALIADGRLDAFKPHPARW